MPPLTGEKPKAVFVTVIEDDYIRESYIRQVKANTDCFDNNGYEYNPVEKQDILPAVLLPIPRIAEKNFVYLRKTEDCDVL